MPSSLPGGTGVIKFPAVGWRWGMRETIQLHLRQQHHHQNDSASRRAALHASHLSVSLFIFVAGPLSQRQYPQTTILASFSMKLLDIWKHQAFCPAHTQTARKCQQKWPSTLSTEVTINTVNKSDHQHCQQKWPSTLSTEVTINTVNRSDHQHCQQKWPSTLSTKVTINTVNRSDHQHLSLIHIWRCRRRS